MALLSSEHEDVRLNEAVAELHRVTLADRAELVAAIVADLREHSIPGEMTFSDDLADRIAAKWGKKIIDSTDK